MPSTDKLYLDDPYATAFAARVVRAQPRETGFAVVLDRSGFYPESGGQLADAGRMADAEVVGVVEDDAGEVVHHVRAETAPHGEVACAIDWDRRYDHMQQHTGQHILSRAFIETGDLQTVSFHMGDDACTIDLEGSGFDAAAVIRAEALANRVVEEGRAIAVRAVPIAELEQEKLRRAVPEGVTEVRLVEIDGFDSVPCCGTHLRDSGEARVIKVLKYEKARGCHRVHFKAGRRALADYAAKHDILSRLSNRLTTGVDGVGAKVEKLLSEGRSAKKAIKQLSLKLAVVEKDLLVAGAEATGGIRVVVRALPDADSGYLRTLASRVQEAGRVVAVLAAKDGSVVAAASDDAGVNLGIAVDLARALGGSGGGKGNFIQLKLPEGSDVERFLETIQNDIHQML